MTQILVTVEDRSIANLLLKTIEKLKGVVNASLYEDVPVANPAKPAETYSARIRRLRGIAKNISTKDIEKDERLAYLLEK